MVAPGKPDRLADIIAALRSAAVDQAMAAERLPENYRVILHEQVAPLAADLAARVDGSAPVIGINGAQASGKSTLALFLSLLLEEGCGLRCPVISIDDLYATRSERAQLAREVHPLLATRGVPGTHDVDLGHAVFDGLQRVGGGDEPVLIPRFDKASDDRFPQSAWTRWEGGADLILFEGWCVGCPPQEPSALAKPVNALERDEDPDGRWRRYVNDQLEGPYAGLFGRIDFLVLLAAPSFACVFDWRLEQERKLADRLAEEGRTGERLLTEETLRRFLAHYQRLTEHMLDVLPARADRVYRLDASRRFAA